MSKEVRNTVSDSDINKLSIIRDELVFNPSASQRKAKAKYYLRSDGILAKEVNATAQGVSKFIDEPAVIKWWSQPGFREWFFNANEAKERLEYLFMLALDTAEAVLLDDKANANAKVQMIKVLATLSGRDKDSKEKLLDEQIQRMTAEQLREFIKTKAPKYIEDKEGNESESDEGLEEDDTDNWE